MPSKEAEFFNNLFKNAPKDPPGTPKDYFKERAENEKRPKPEIPEGLKITEMNLGGNYAELLEKEGNGDVLVFYIHGGGFTTGAAQERREITFHIASERGYNVIANNYRLSPEHKWPAHLMDCVNTYRAILDMGYDPQKIVVMGESAGATLTVSLALYLRDHNMPLPAACVAFSICSNQCGEFPSHWENIETDYMIGDAINRDDQIEAVFGNVKDTEKIRKSPYASSYYADFTGIPPIFLAASDTEALRDDSVYLYEKLQKEGHICQLDIQHDVCHAYPMFPVMPEAQDTLDKVFAFISDVV